MQVVLAGRRGQRADRDLGAVDDDALAFTGNLVMQALPELEAFVLGRK